MCTGSQLIEPHSVEIFKVKGTISGTLLQGEAHFLFSGLSTLATVRSKADSCQFFLSGYLQRGLGNGFLSQIFVNKQIKLPVPHERCSTAPGSSKQRII